MDRDRPPRLVPDRPFPPYTYVPNGGRPHPVSDPAGHRYGLDDPRPPRLDPAGWRSSEEYLYGIDLFNAGYYWEAHVSWEALWHASGRAGPVADVLKALIKLAASGVKHLEGRPRGVAVHARRAAELLRGVAASRGDGAGRSFLGLRLEALIELTDAIARDGWPAGSVALRPDNRCSSSL